MLKEHVEFLKFGINQQAEWNKEMQSTIEKLANYPGLPPGVHHELRKIVDDIKENDFKIYALKSVFSVIDEK